VELTGACRQETVTSAMASTRAGRKGRLEHLIRCEPEFRSGVRNRHAI
jgi:hypothetical protein